MHPSIYLCIWPHHEAGTESPLASHITSRSPATQPTTESHCCFLVLPKMSEKPATAVHPLNRSSKGGPSTILQQDALQKNCRNAKAHRILYILPLWQWLDRSCKSLLPSFLGAPESAIWSSSCSRGSSIFVGFGVSPRIPFKANSRTHAV